MRRRQIAPERQAIEAAQAAEVARRALIDGVKADLASLSDEDRGHVLAPYLGRKKLKHGL